MDMHRARSQWMYSLLVNDFHPHGVSPGRGSASERVKRFRHEYLRRVALCSLVDGYSQSAYRKMGTEARYV